MPSVTTLLVAIFLVVPGYPLRSYLRTSVYREDTAPTNVSVLIESIILSLVINLAIVWGLYLGAKESFSRFCTSLVLIFLGGFSNTHNASIIDVIITYTLVVLSVSFLAPPFAWAVVGLISNYTRKRSGSASKASSGTHHAQSKSHSGTDRRAPKEAHNK